MLPCTVALLALLAAGCASSGSRSEHNAPVSRNRLEQAFVRWLDRHHPGFRGHSVCPSEGAARQPERPPCVAELHNGTNYVEVWAMPSLESPVVFHHISTGSWTRRWSKYSRPPQRISRGLISVNATGFDWRWLVLGVDYECRRKHRETCTASALDGQFGGYPLYDVFFDFRCQTRGRLISCRNKLGDALRWLPQGRAST